MNGLLQIASQIEASPNHIKAYQAREVLRSVYLSSLKATAKHLLGYNEINDRTHGEIIEALQNNSKRKLIVCPRGTFKSTLCVVAYSIWTIINNHNARILIDSELFANSRTFLREIRAHLEHPSLTALFGEFRTDTNWSDGSLTIKQRTEYRKESTITCGGVGTNKTGAHYTHILHDDMNSNKNSATEDGRKKVIDHYRLNISILEPDGVMIIVGTRYSANDLIGFILETELGLKSDGSDFN